MNEGASSVADEGFEPVSLRHIPNPTDKHTHRDFPTNPFRFMWYYRTELHNNLSVPIRLVWFEGYNLENGSWIPRNITGSRLDRDTFMLWYSDGDPAIDGWIAPGQTAVCDGNWHGNEYSYVSEPTKWAFMFSYADGNEYFVEAQIDSVPQSTSIWSSLLRRLLRSKDWRS